MQILRVLFHVFEQLIAFQNNETYKTVKTYKFVLT